MVHLAILRLPSPLWDGEFRKVGSKVRISGADNALKALLRFLYNDRHLLLRLSSASKDLTRDCEGLVSRLHIWSDASHAPYRFNKRKGISGEVIAYKNAIVRTVAKQQQATSLSSYEAELYAIQLGAQDSVGLSKFLQRSLFALARLRSLHRSIYGWRVTR